MNTISNASLPLPLRPADLQSRPAQNASRASAVGIHSTSHLGGTLTLRTEEGDTVNIQLSQDREATYARLGARFRGEHGFGRSVVSRSSVSQSSSLSIQVEGSLNEKEQAEVDALVATFRRAAELFASGDEAGSNALLAGYEAQGTLEGFRADFERSESHDVVRLRSGGGRRRHGGEGEEQTQPVIKPQPAPTPVREVEVAPVVKPVAERTPVRETIAAPDPETPAARPVAVATENPHADLIRRLDEGRRQFAAWLQQDAQPAARTTLASAIAGSAGA